MKELVFFKGTKSGVQIILDDKEEFEKVFERLKEKLKVSSIFLVGSSLSLDTGERKLNEEEYKKIENLLKEEYGLTFLGIEKDVEEIVSKKEQSIEEISLKEASQAETILIKKTLRSGQVVNHSGNVVIVGDVNPGAEVVAGGDVIVFGVVRGTVQAGAGGNRAAKIYTLKFQTPQIKIAEYIARLEERKTQQLQPQFAEIENNKIIIKKIE